MVAEGLNDGKMKKFGRGKGNVYIKIHDVFINIQYKRHSHNEIRSIGRLGG